MPICRTVFAHLHGTLELVRAEIAKFLDRHVVDPGRVGQEIDHLIAKMDAARATNPG